MNKKYAVRTKLIEAMKASTFEITDKKAKARIDDPEMDNIFQLEIAIPGTSGIVITTFESTIINNPRYFRRIQE